MGKQKQAGKAFEFAVARGIIDLLGEDKIEALSPREMEAAQVDFDSLSPQTQAELLTAVQGPLRTIEELEPHLQVVRAGIEKLSLTFLPDSAGAEGDVRDLVLSLPYRNWQIGISAKHNHEAVKHSRLSAALDFGHKWLQLPVSATYFQEIAPVFAFIEAQIMEGKLWSELEAKEELVYTPILTAFCRELKELDRLHSGLVAPRLVEYLIGRRDFYKLMKFNRCAKLQMFNFRGELSRSCNRITSAYNCERMRLPTRIVEIDYKRGADSRESGNTLWLILDAGWQLSLRLHSASSRVERSLKFDIKFEGLPTSIETLCYFHNEAP